jgi:2-methylcitrate dehydratase PrpD
MPAFMGPDSKLLIPATTTVDGCRAAELAARGWSGSHVILEDKEGFLKRYNANAFTWMLSGFGDAWVTDSLCYKIVPGCAYIDTAIDAFTSLNNEHGPFAASDIESIDVRCGLLTTGMEGFATSYRSADRLDPISINFSVALSIGLMLHAGELRPEFFSHKYLDANREPIEAAAAKVSMRYDTEMDKIGARAGEGGTSVTSLLGAQTLAGQDFQSYVMAFPSEVTINGEHTALQEVPFGGAGRPRGETAQLVERKFRENFTGDADAALAAINALDETDDVSSVVALLA